MTYRFKLQEPLASGVSRIGLEQVDIAEARLVRNDDIATAIHDSRRCLKRLRALLRLVRPVLDERTFRREIKRVAAVGKQLAGARDHHVMLQTLAKLEHRFGALPNGAGMQLKKLMANGRGPSSRRASALERRQALAGLEQTRAFFARAAHKTIALAQVTEGMERAYRKARRAFRAAYESPSDEAFHSWRKATQQHWRHMQLLSRGWPEVLGGRAAEAKELSRLLGDDHDLAVLLAFVTDRGKAVPSPDDPAALAQLCRSCQSDLRDLAKPYGDRLFAERPGDLSESVERYWSAARRLSTLAPCMEDAVPAVKRETATQQRGARAARSAAQAASRGSRGPRSRRSGR